MKEMLLTMPNNGTGTVLKEYYSEPYYSGPNSSCPMLYNANITANKFSKCLTVFFVSKESAEIKNIHESHKGENILETEYFKIKAITLEPTKTRNIDKIQVFIPADNKQIEEFAKNRKMHTDKFRGKDSYIFNVVNSITLQAHDTKYQQMFTRVGTASRVNIPDYSDLSFYTGHVHLSSVVYSILNAVEASEKKEYNDKMLEYLIDMPQMSNADTTETMLLSQNFYHIIENHYFTDDIKYVSNGYSNSLFIKVDNAENVFGEVTKFGIGVVATKKKDLVGMGDVISKTLGWIKYGKNKSEILPEGFLFNDIDSKANYNYYTFIVHVLLHDYKEELSDTTGLKNMSLQFIKAISNTYDEIANENKNIPPLISQPVLVLLFINRITLDDFKATERKKVAKFIEACYNKTIVNSMYSISNGEVRNKVLEYVKEKGEF